MLRASYPPSSLHCIRCIGESATVEVAESDTPMADAETISKIHTFMLFTIMVNRKRTQTIVFL